MAASEVLTDKAYEEMARAVLAGWKTDHYEECKHDLPLLMKALDEFNVDQWHNTAYEILNVELLNSDNAPELVLISTLAEMTGFDLGGFLNALINTSFAVGHMIGEGPEHIQKCQCEHNNKRPSGV
jgi:hypothetical protein